MTRRRLTARQKAEIFAAAKGLCHECKGKIDVTERWDVDHVIPLCLGGADKPSNMAPIHEHCHRGAGGKTSRDRKALAKSDSVRAKHIGAKDDRRAVIPGSKASRFKKRLDGTVWDRETGERIR